MLDNIIENLEQILPHREFYILKNCLSIPKLIYLLHNNSCFKCKEELKACDTTIKTSMEKYAMCLLEKKAGHKHPYQSSMEGLASTPLHTCLYHVSCHHLMPLRASTDISFPLLTRNPSWWSEGRNWCLVPTPWFFTTTQGNTISLGWPRLQGFTKCLAGIY